VAAASSEASIAPVTSSAAKGPFGIKLGAPLETVGKTTKIEGPGVYVVDSPPKAHSAFETVAVVAFPETGICTVRAAGHTIDNDSGGIQIRTAVDQLAAALTLKYGEPESRDTCFGNDVECQSDFWMMTLRNNERAYGYVWEGAKPALQSAGLSFVGLMARATDGNSTYAIVEYQGTNTTACEQAVQMSTAEAL
jgi:hypothetical protein